MPPTRARASEPGASSAQASSGPRGFAQHREWLGRVEKFLSEIGIASDSDDDSAAPSTEPSPIPTPSPCSETAQASTGNSTGTTSVAPDSSATTTLAPAPGPQAPTEASAPSGAAGPQAPPAPSAPSMASLSSPQRTAARELLDSMPAELIAASLPTLTLYLLEYLGKRTDRSRTQDLDQLEQLQPDIDQLLAAGEEYKAYLLLCERAFRAVAKYGFSPNVREDSVRAVLDVLDIEYLWGETPVPLYEWVLPRAVELWGVDHAHTRKIVHRAALEVCQLRDPREHVEFARTVTELAQQLPGGLGWGSTVVAPMPDEEAYNRHAMMQYQALVAINKGQYSLAHTMLQRCVTFYESLGQHWLGTVRKVKALSSIALCVKNIEGAQAAEPYAVKCKRTAQKELGTTHEITLGIAWEVSFDTHTHTHMHTLNTHTHTHTQKGSGVRHMRSPWTLHGR